MVPDRKTKGPYVRGRQNLLDRFFIIIIIIMEKKKLFSTEKESICPKSSKQSKVRNKPQKKRNHAECEDFGIYAFSNSLKLWNKCVLPSQEKGEMARRGNLGG